MENYNQQLGTANGVLRSIGVLRENSNKKAYHVCTVELSLTDGTKKLTTANMSTKVAASVNDEVAVAFSKDSNGAVWCNIIGQAGGSPFLETDLELLNLTAPRIQTAAEAIAAAFGQNVG